MVKKNKSVKNKFLIINNNYEENFVYDESGDYLVFLNNASGNFVFDIQAEGVNLNIFGLYLGKRNDVFSMRTTQHHYLPNSTSNLLIKGVFYDQSKFNYQGLIRIDEKAQKTHAYQKNQNLVMSDQVFVQSKPYLEILANDVFCTHGSTTGRVNQEQLNYIKTKGINQKDALKLIVSGFINEVIEKIKSINPNFKSIYD